MPDANGKVTIGELVRTKGGAVVHTAACTIGKRGSSRTPWNYAAGRTMEEVRRIADLHGLKLCKRCLP